MISEANIAGLIGAKVVDRDGDKIGSVGQIYVDPSTGRPNWASVKTGLFGTSESFVPLEDALEEGDSLRVPYEKAMVKDAPRIEDDAGLSPAEEEELYSYYHRPSTDDVMTRSEDRLDSGRQRTVDSRQVQEQAVDEITAAIRSRLLERVDRGEELTNLGDVEEVAEQVVDRLPIAASPWAEIVGPCYTSGSLQKELGRGRAAVSKAVAELRLLRLRTADGRTVYPAFQIVDGSTVRGMREVLTELRRGIDDEWTWAQWLNTPVPDESSEDGASRRRRNIDRLIAGEVDSVVKAAQRTAASWAA